MKHFIDKFAGEFAVFCCAYLWAITFIIELTTI